VKTSGASPASEQQGPHEGRRHGLVSRPRYEPASRLSVDAIERQACVPVSSLVATTALQRAGSRERSFRGYAAMAGDARGLNIPVSRETFSYLRLDPLRAWGACVRAPSPGTARRYVRPVSRSLRAGRRVVACSPGASGAKALAAGGRPPGAALYASGR